jgi:hypothetical protein
MTAEYANDRRRRRLVILVGLVLAIVATAGVYLVLSRNSNTQPTVPMRNVVVAAKTIPARSLIASDQVTTKSVPSSRSLRFPPEPPSRRTSSERATRQASTSFSPMKRSPQIRLPGAGYPSTCPRTARSAAS